METFARRISTSPRPTWEIGQSNCVQLNIINTMEIRRLRRVLFVILSNDDDDCAKNTSLER